MQGAGRGVEGGRDNTAQPGAQGTTHHLIMGRAVTIVQTTDCGRGYTFTHTLTHTHTDMAYSGTSPVTCQHSRKRTLYTTHYAVNTIVLVQHITTTDSDLHWTALRILNNPNKSGLSSSQERINSIL